MLRAVFSLTLARIRRRIPFQRVAVVAMAGAVTACASQPPTTSHRAPPSRSPPAPTEDDRASTRHAESTPVPQSDAATTTEPAPGPEATGAAGAGDGGSPVESPAASSPLDPTPLAGPFASIEAYLRDHPIGHHESCPPLPPPTQGPRSFGQGGAVLETKAVRAPGSFACAVVEYCLLGIRTRAGWFIRQTERPCHGVVGPGQRDETTDLDSRWVPSGSSAILAVESTHRHISQSVVATREGKRESESIQEHRQAYFCGVGESGRPSCTDALLLSCQGFDGTQSQVQWSFEGDRLTLSADEDLTSACDLGEPLVGTFSLVFP